MCVFVHVHLHFSWCLFCFFFCNFLSTFIRYNHFVFSLLIDALKCVSYLLTLMSLMWLCIVCCCCVCVCVITEMDESLIVIHFYSKSIVCAFCIVFSYIKYISPFIVSLFICMFNIKRMKFIKKIYQKNIFFLLLNIRHLPLFYGPFYLHNGIKSVYYLDSNSLGFNHLKKTATTFDSLCIHIESST